MVGNRTRVSIGLPVFNGENYLAEALDSLLAQTYEDFELIISDNASSDGTREICQAYAARDPRIRYYRNERNLGAARNFNRVFELSSGEYFKWAAHDDLCAPKFVERCVETLGEPSVILSHPTTIIIDERGKYLRDYDDHLNLRSPRPQERFRDYLFRPAGECNAIFGLIRASELRQTPLIGSYTASDAVLLGELALRGEFCQIPDHSFFRRDHPRASRHANPTHNALAAWFDPANRGKVLLSPLWRLFFEYLRAIRRVRLHWYERTCCYLYMMKWLCEGPAWLLQQHREKVAAKRPNLY